MDHFTESYYPAVLQSVIRLTGLAHEKEVAVLADDILGDLRQREDELEAAGRKGVLVFRVIIIHVFSFLEARGDKRRIQLLREILPSMDGGRKNPPQGESLTGDVGV